MWKSARRCMDIPKYFIFIFLTASLYIKEKADKTRDVATKHHNTFMFSINISNCPLLLSEACAPCPW